MAVRGVLQGVAVLRARPRPRGDAQDAGAAFVTAVHAEHSAALLGYALRLTGDRGRAEDIVQETLLRVWKHNAMLAADSRPLRPWLFTVAANLAADDRRARRSRPTELGGELAGDQPAPDELERALEPAGTNSPPSPDYRACWPGSTRQPWPPAPISIRTPIRDCWTGRWSNSPGNSAGRWPGEGSVLSRPR